MEYLHIDNHIDNQTILETLCEIFPDLTIYHFDFSDDEPESFDIDNSNHIFFNTEFRPDNIELKYTICIYRMDENYSAERALYVGKIFSDRNHVRVLITYTKPDEPKDPYYDIIFENGNTFLADDSDTCFGHGTQGLVQIITEYELPILKFDSRGQFKNESP